MHVQLFTVCTELILSLHRADCERATQPYSSGGGGYDFSRLKTSRVLPHTSVLVIECFLARSMLFLKCIYTLYTVIFFQLHYMRNAIYFNHSLFFVVSSDVLNFYGHSQCPCIYVARLCVLHYDTIAHVVNIPGKSMSTG